MSRGLHRRRQRAKKKGRLCADDVRHLDKQRRMPDFPETFETAFPIWTAEEQVQPYLGRIRKSRVARSLERRLRNHPGQESRISMEALLLAAMLTTDILGSYRRTDICAVLNGFPSQVAYQLGLWDPDNPPPISYHAVCVQIQRLEESLGATWTGTGEAVRDLAWLCHTLIAAGVPRKWRKNIKSITFDSKVIESWGVSKTFVKEKDALAEHRLEEREQTDLDEPDLPTVTGPITYEIGTFGPDGRLIRSHDPDARLTYKTSTTREKARIVLGYDLHLASAVPAVKWAGNPRTLAYKEALPRFITAMVLAPGATNPGPIGLDLVSTSKRIAPGIEEVIADRGYTNKRKTFCRDLHKQGINVVMDYNPLELRAAKTVDVGRNGKQQLFLQAGSFFPPWLPDDLLVPPADLTGDKLDKWYANRACWRWTVHKYLDDGSVQLVCPQCAGRVKTSAKTRNPSPPKKQAVPFLNIDDEYCCNGTVTVPVDKLDSFQRIPAKTTAWKKSYQGRRNTSENKNSMLGSKGNFALEWCRVFNMMAFTLGALVKVIAHNLEEASRFLRNQPKRPKPVTETERSDPPRDDTQPTSDESPRAPP